MSSLHVDSSPLSLAARVVAAVSGHLPASLKVSAADALGLSTHAGESGFTILSRLAERDDVQQIGGASDNERAEVAQWGAILAAEPLPLNLAFLQRLDKQLLTSSYLPALAYRPTVADYAVWAAVTGGASKSSFDAAALPNLARWTRAVAASIPRAGAAVESFFKGTPLAGDAAVEASLPASAIFDVDIAAATIAAESKRAAVPPAAASAAAPAAAAGKDAKKGDDKRTAAGKAAAAPAATAAAPAAAAAAAGAPAAAAAGAKGDKPAKEKKEKAEKAPKAAPAEVSQIYRVDLRVGKIVSVAAHPTEARLLVLRIDVGAELGGERVVVSGLAEHFSAEQLTGINVVLMVNVAPGNVKGVDSFGRVMVATSADGSKKELATPPAAAKVGEQITFASVPATSKPDTPSVAAKRLHEIMKGLKTSADKVVQYNNDDFTTSAGPVTVATIAEGTVA